MAREEDNSRHRDVSGRLEILVSIFYGFAIASGLPEGIDAIVNSNEHDSTPKWIAIFTALILALSDLLFVYTHDTIFQYRRPGGFARFLMDIAFPVVLFFLLFFPPLLSARDAIIWFTGILFVYFLLASIYPVLLKLEQQPVQGLQFYAVMSLAICAIGVMLAANLAPWWLILPVDVAATAVWARFNFWRAYANVMTQSE